MSNIQFYAYFEVDFDIPNVEFCTLKKKKKLSGKIGIKLDIANVEFQAELDTNNVEFQNREIFVI